MKGICINCGCSHDRPCTDHLLGQACHWIDDRHDLCSACAFAVLADLPEVDSLQVADLVIRCQAHVLRRLLLSHNDVIALLSAAGPEPEDEALVIPEDKRLWVPT